MKTRIDLWIEADQKLALQDRAAKLRITVAELLRQIIAEGLAKRVDRGREK